jgi:hypothetical protein
MQCCFCGLSIARTDSLAIRLSIINMSRNDKDAPVQGLFAHDLCLAEKLHASVPFDGESLRD